MEHSRRRSAQRAAATLFDSVSDSNRDDFRERVRSFAVEVAKRHRRGGGELGEMLTALRGWHRTWAICAPNRVPPLDEPTIALAVAAYTKAGHKRQPAAA